MKPPHCYVCDLDLWAIQGPWADHFVLVHLGGHWKQPEALVGHPVNAFWFCLEHASLAKERESMYYETALAEIDALLNRANQ